jgi:drug/metabolite transporter (DMT)-like permease
LIALQGFCLFSANYCLYYLGSTYFISGIVAVIFASIMLFNIINMRIIFGKPIALRVLLGAGIGMLGLITIMATEILHLPKTNISHTLTGLGICLLATLLASWGNILSAYHQQQGLAILPTNTLGMLYGTVFLLSFALLLHQPPQFSWQASYIYSLLYLTLFGTVLAFGVYLKLLGRIGAERAAYTFIVIPLIAMLLSTVFEDFHWHFHTFVGTFLILWGNYLVLIKNRASLCSQEK